MSRPGASLRPGRARRSRDHLAIDSVQSKLPSLSVSVSSSPVSREASRDSVALDRPFDDGRVQAANVAVSTSTVSANMMYYLMFMFRAKRPYYLRHMSDIHETAEKGMPDERGRRKTAELHTSGAKRAETWRGGVK